MRPQGDFFYTVGHDACVKFWDWGPNIHRDDSALAAGSTGSADTERALTYRSRLTQQLGSPLLGLVFLRAGAELVTCAGDKVSAFASWKKSWRVQEYFWGVGSMKMGF